MTQKDGTWTTTPPARTAGTRNKILRCPAVRLRPLVITSHEVLYVGIHWVGGRSKPCPGEKTCPHCREQYPTYKGYLAVWNPETNEQFCLEITPPCFGTCVTYQHLYTTLKGGTISLTRAGSKANGRMSASIVPSNIPPTQIPEPIDVQACMHEAWASPNKGEKIKMNPPPDTLAGETEARQLIQRLKDQGFLDEHGQPTEKTKDTVDVKEAIKNERWKLSKTYKATQEQLAMLEANRRAKNNGSEVHS